MLSKVALLLTLTFLAIQPSEATVYVVVSTYDGLVIAADSRITYQDSQKTRIVSDFGQKIVRIGSHAAISFCGTAHLLDHESKLRSISSIAEIFKAKSSFTDSTMVSPIHIVLGLDTLLTSLYNQNTANRTASLLITVIGYDEKKERRIYELKFPIVEEIDSSEFNIHAKLDTITQTPLSIVRGQLDAYLRLFKGYDKRIADHDWFRSFQKITVDSLDSITVDTTTEHEQLNLDTLRYEVNYLSMTLQDAIDYAIFIVRATIEAQRFNQASIQGVGGPIDIAVITPDGFKWIQRKQLHGEIK